jgi:methyl-accepting chemotaxis protein
MDLVSVVLAPIRVPMRIASALDDLAVIADRARRDPDPVEEVRWRIDALILELGELVAVTKELVGGGAELTQEAKNVHEVAAALVHVARSLDDTSERIYHGGNELTATARILSGETRELIDGGKDLTNVSERLDADMRVFRSVLPRLMEVLPVVEHLEDAVETVAETIEPLQGAAERVGRVTNRLTRSRAS